MARPKILVVVSSHKSWPEAGRDTGYWIGEVSHFVEVVNVAGYDVDLVSPLGGEPPMDPKSVHGMQSMDGGYRAYREDPELQRRLRETRRPDEVDPADYVAVYFAGGHGVMWDFAGNDDLAALAATVYEQGGVVSAVCHGVAALLDVELSDGGHLLEGRRVTGFANIEERLMRLTSKVPYLTEDELRDRGARYERGAPFLARAVVDGSVVTGQNPGSTTKVAERVVEVLADSAGD